MTDIRFHPNDDILTCYAAGDLEPATSIMLSAHLELCSHCRARVAELEDAQAQKMALVPSEPLSEELNDLLDTILCHPDLPRDEVAEATKAHIEINSKLFMLPRALQQHDEQIGPWSRLPGNIKRAHVATGGHSKMNFIYMDCNSALPQHTHQGLEITLVLAGEFMDEHATYKPGDFIVQTSEHRHAPKTRADQDCLCLTLLDAPLHFTTGLATLLNPFSQLFFR